MRLRMMRTSQTSRFDPADESQEPPWWDEPGMAEFLDGICPN